MTQAAELNTSLGIDQLIEESGYTSLEEYLAPALKAKNPERTAALLILKLLGLKDLDTEQECL